ncbi:MAG: hypothetical protein GY832_44505 [Chloroflexi bacterium]|nr:hypothetical protein [Chloroflexota bacterium]
MSTQQMALFAIPEPEPPPEKPDPLQEHQPPAPAPDGIIDPGPVGCSSNRCKQRGIYRDGSTVKCERHASSIMKAENGKAPHVLHCPDGFNLVREDDRPWHYPLGDWERVQVCKCKVIFRVEQHWTGEPLRCPECVNVALREVLEKK